MPPALPALAAVLATPLLGLALHAASTHARGAPLSTRASAILPHNLCASCHGGGKVVSASAAGSLAASDLMAARRYLADAPRG